MFSVRMVSTSHYQAEPLPEVDVCYSSFRSSAVRRVPVLRVFGATPAGQKTCMHVHGVFPYLYVPYDGTQPADSYLRRFAASLDKAINVANNNQSNIQHVFKISLVAGIPMYGYHDEEQQFLKIYLYNPGTVRKAADLLLGGAVMNKSFQPHESHIPFPLQLFMDYNLYGMNMVNVAAVKFRRKPQAQDDGQQPRHTPGEGGSADSSMGEGGGLSGTPQSSLSSAGGSTLTNTPSVAYWDLDHLPSDLLLPASVERQSVCELEVDVVAADILNRRDVTDNIGKNPGLAALWEDERQRRRDVGQPSQITPQQSQEHEHVESSSSERELLDRFREILQQQRALRRTDSEESEMSVEEESSVSPEDITITPASLLEDHSQSVAQNTDSQDSEKWSQDTVVLEEGEGEEEGEEGVVISLESIQRVVSFSQSFSQPSSTEGEAAADQSLVEVLAALAEESSSAASQHCAAQVSALEEQDSMVGRGVALPPDSEALQQDEEDTLTMSQTVQSDHSEGYDVEGLDCTWDGSPEGQSGTLEHSGDDNDDNDDDDIPQLDGASDPKPASKKAGGKKRLGVRGPVLSSTPSSSGGSSQREGGRGLPADHKGQTHRPHSLPPSPPADKGPPLTLAAPLTNGGGYEASPPSSPLPCGASVDLSTAPRVCGVDSGQGMCVTWCGLKQPSGSCPVPSSSSSSSVCTPSSCLPHCSPRTEPSSPGSFTGGPSLWGQAGGQHLWEMASSLAPVASCQDRPPTSVGVDSSVKDVSRCGQQGSDHPVGGSPSGGDCVVRMERVDSVARRLPLSLNKTRRPHSPPYTRKTTTPPPPPTPAAPSSPSSYSFTFHLPPTPVYKRSDKTHSVFYDAEEVGQPVRVHPRDSQQNSLGKIGREVVRVTKLTQQEVTGAGVGRCADVRHSSGAGVGSCEDVKEAEVEGGCVAQRLTEGGSGDVCDASSAGDSRTEDCGSEACPPPADSRGYSQGGGRGRRGRQRRLLGPKCRRKPIGGSSHLSSVSCVGRGGEEVEGEALAPLVSLVGGGSSTLHQQPWPPHCPSVKNALSAPSHSVSCNKLAAVPSHDAPATRCEKLDEGDCADSLGASTAWPSCHASLEISLFPLPVSTSSSSSPSVSVTSALKSPPVSSSSPSVNDRGGRGPVPVSSSSPPVSSSPSVNNKGGRGSLPVSSPVSSSSSPGSSSSPPVSSSSSSPAGDSPSGREGSASSVHLDTDQWVKAAITRPSVCLDDCAVTPPSHLADLEGRVSTIPPTGGSSLPSSPPLGHHCPLSPGKHSPQDSRQESTSSRGREHQPHCCPLRQCADAPSSPSQQQQTSAHCQQPAVGATNSVGAVYQGTVSSSGSPHSAVLCSHSRRVCDSQSGGDITAAEQADVDDKEPKMETSKNMSEESDDAVLNVNSGDDDGSSSDKNEKSSTQGRGGGRRNSSSGVGLEAKAADVGAVAALPHSSTQLWSVGDSASDTDSQESQESSSDDYCPSRPPSSKRRKRKGRPLNKSGSKRAKWSSSVNNGCAHSGAKHWGDKKNGRKGQSKSSVRHAKGKGKKEERLIEGVHYIVVGKFKGHRVMLVKLHRVKVGLDDRVKVSGDGAVEKAGSVSKPKPRLLGPRCRRLAKDGSGCDPGPLHTPSKVQPVPCSDSESDDSPLALLSEKAVPASDPPLPHTSRKSSLALLSEKVVSASDPPSPHTSRKSPLVLLSEKAVFASDPPLPHTSKKSPLALLSEKAVSASDPPLPHTSRKSPLALLSEKTVTVSDPPQPHSPSKVQLAAYSDSDSDDNLPLLHKGTGRVKESPEHTGGLNSVESKEQNAVSSTGAAALLLEGSQTSVDEECSRVDEVTAVNTCITKEESVPVYTEGWQQAHGVLTSEEALVHSSSVISKELQQQNSSLHSKLHMQNSSLKREDIFQYNNCLNGEESQQQKATVNTGESKEHSIQDSQDQTVTVTAVELQKQNSIKSEELQQSNGMFETDSVQLPDAFEKTDRSHEQGTDDGGSRQLVARQRKGKKALCRASSAPCDLKSTAVKEESSVVTGVGRKASSVTGRAGKEVNSVMSRAGKEVNSVMSRAGKEVNSVMARAGKEVNSVTASGLPSQDLCCRGEAKVTSCSTRLDQRPLASWLPCGDAVSSAEGESSQEGSGGLPPPDVDIDSRLGASECTSLTQSPVSKATPAHLPFAMSEHSQDADCSSLPQSNADSTSSSPAFPCMALTQADSVQDTHHAALDDTPDTPGATSKELCQGDTASFCFQAVRHKVKEVRAGHKVREASSDSSDSQDRGEEAAALRKGQAQDSQTPAFSWDDKLQLEENAASGADADKEKLKKQRKLTPNQRLGVAFLSKRRRKGKVKGGGAGVKSEGGSKVMDSLSLLHMATLASLGARGDSGGGSGGDARYRCTPWRLVVRKVEEKENRNGRVLTDSNLQWTTFTVPKREGGKGEDVTAGESMLSPLRMDRVGGEDGRMGEEDGRLAEGVHHNHHPHPHTNVSEATDQGHKRMDDSSDDTDDYQVSESAQNHRQEEPHSETDAKKKDPSSSDTNTKRKDTSSSTSNTNRKETATESSGDDGCRESESRSDFKMQKEEACRIRRKSNGHKPPLYEDSDEKTDDYTVKMPMKRATSGQVNSHRKKRVKRKAQGGSSKTNKASKVLDSLDLLHMATLASLGTDPPPPVHDDSLPCYTDSVWDHADDYQESLIKMSYTSPVHSDLADLSPPLPLSPQDLSKVNASSIQKQRAMPCRLKIEESRGTRNVCMAQVRAANAAERLAQSAQRSVPGGRNSAGRVQDGRAALKLKRPVASARSASESHTHSGHTRSVHRPSARLLPPSSSFAGPPSIPNPDKLPPPSIPWHHPLHVVTDCVDEGAWRQRVVQDARTEKFNSRSANLGDSGASPSLVSPRSKDAPHAQVRAASLSSGSDPFPQPPSPFSAALQRDRSRAVQQPSSSSSSLGSSGDSSTSPRVVHSDLRRLSVPLGEIHNQVVSRPLPFTSLAQRYAHRDRGPDRIDPPSASPAVSGLCGQGGQKSPAMLHPEASGMDARAFCRTGSQGYQQNVSPAASDPASGGSFQWSSRSPYSWRESSDAVHCNTTNRSLPAATISQHSVGVKSPPAVKNRFQWSRSVDGDEGRSRREGRVMAADRSAPTSIPSSAPTWAPGPAKWLCDISNVSGTASGSVGKPGTAGQTSHLSPRISRTELVISQMFNLESGSGAEKPVTSSSRSPHSVQADRWQEGRNTCRPPLSDQDREPLARSTLHPHHSSDLKSPSSASWEQQSPVGFSAAQDHYPSGPSQIPTALQCPPNRLDSGKHASASSHGSQKSPLALQYDSLSTSSSLGARKSPIASQYEHLSVGSTHGTHKSPLASQYEHLSSTSLYGAHKSPIASQYDEGLRSVFTDSSRSQAVLMEKDRRARSSSVTVCDSSPAGWYKPTRSPGQFDQITSPPAYQDTVQCLLKSPRGYPKDAASAKWPPEYICENRSNFTLKSSSSFDASAKGREDARSAVSSGAEKNLYRSSSCSGNAADRGFSGLKTADVSGFKSPVVSPSFSAVSGGSRSPCRGSPAGKHWDSACSSRPSKPDSWLQHGRKRSVGEYLEEVIKSTYNKGPAEQSWSEASRENSTGPVPPSQQAAYTQAFSQNNSEAEGVTSSALDLSVFSGRKADSEGVYASSSSQWNPAVCVTDVPVRCTPSPPGHSVASVLSTKYSVRRTPSPPGHSSVLSTKYSVRRTPSPPGQSVASLLSTKYHTSSLTAHTTTVQSCKSAASSSFSSTSHHPTWTTIKTDDFENITDDEDEEEVIPSSQGYSSTAYRFPGFRRLSNISSAWTPSFSLHTPRGAAPAVGENASKERGGLSGTVPMSSYSYLTSLYSGYSSKALYTQCSSSGVPEPSSQVNGEHRFSGTGEDTRERYGGLSRDSVTQGPQTQGVGSLNSVNQDPQRESEHYRGSGRDHGILDPHEIVSRGFQGDSVTVQATQREEQYRGLDRDNRTQGPHRDSVTHRDDVQKSKEHHGGLDTDAVTQGPQRDIMTSQRDTGSMSRNTGSMLRDSGSMLRDIGSMSRDTGSMLRETGSMLRDVAASQREGGAVASSLGTPWQDSQQWTSQPPSSLMSQFEPITDSEEEEGEEGAINSRERDPPHSHTRTAQFMTTTMSSAAFTNTGTFFPGRFQVASSAYSALGGSSGMGGPASSSVHSLLQDRPVSSSSSLLDRPVYSSSSLQDRPVSSSSLLSRQDCAASSAGYEGTGVAMTGKRPLHGHLVHAALDSSSPVNAAGHLLSGDGGDQCDADDDSEPEDGGGRRKRRRGAGASPTPSPPEDRPPSSSRSHPPPHKGGEGGDGSEGEGSGWARSVEAGWATSGHVLCPRAPPPSRSAVEASAVHEGLSVEPVVPPFCSHPPDLPDTPRELGGRVLRLPTTTVRELEELPAPREGGEGGRGLGFWQSLTGADNPLLCSQRPSSPSHPPLSLPQRLQAQPALRFALTGDSTCIITPVTTPPPHSQVTAWLQGLLQRVAPGRHREREEAAHSRGRGLQGEGADRGEQPGGDREGLDITLPLDIDVPVDEREEQVGSGDSGEEEDSMFTRLRLTARQSGEVSCRTAADSGQDPAQDCSTPKRQRLDSGGILHSTPVQPSTSHLSPLTCTPISGGESSGGGQGESRAEEFATPRRPPVRRVSTNTQVALTRALMSSDQRRQSLEGERSQIDAPTPKNVHGFKVTQQHLQNAKALHKYQYLTVLSMELHTDSRGDLTPDPEVDAVRALFYGVFDDVPPERGRQKVTGAIVVDPLSCIQAGSPVAGRTKGAGGGGGRGLFDRCGVEVGEELEVTYVKTELELLHTFTQLILRLDPDILLGFEIQQMSWGFLLQRAAQLSVNLCAQIARISGSKQGNRFSAEKDEWGADYSSEIHIEGRIVLNLWRILRHEVTLNVYSYENCAFHVLHRRVPTFTYRTLTTWYSQRSHLHTWRVVHHYTQRVTGQLDIVDRLDLIGKTSEFARVFGIEFYDVLTRGTQYRVESIMLRLAKPLNFIAVSPSVQQRARQKAPECIPLTLEPQSLMYTDPVVVLDFQSLYPSIMIAYNYCFSTCLGRLQHLHNSSEGPIEFGCTSLTISPETLKKVKKHVTVSPNGCVFVTGKVRRGVLPMMVEEILKTRLMVKKSMKDYKEDKTLHRLLDARQLGLKLIANVTYGYTGASFSGRMPCVEVGDSIVRKARESLERAIQVVEQRGEWGARVVYGDTDSLFIHLPGRSRHQAFLLGQEMADTITSIFPKPIKLKFEKVYLPCVLQTKKRYVGMMYETPEQKEGVFDAKGIETVRRDNCGVVSKVLERCIKILFLQRDVSQVRSYLHRQIGKMMAGRVGLQDFVFAKEYRGMMGYKPGACVPALEIARKRLREDRRGEPRVGERVPYVIVHGSPGLPLIQLVRQPHDLLRDPALRINVTYYINKQVLPPLDRLLSLVGVSVFQWYRDMPRVVRVTPSLAPPHAAHAPHTTQGTISQYFVTSDCLVCERQTKEAVCASCRQDPQMVAVTLASHCANLEALRHRLTQVCHTCTGAQDVSPPCVSLDCPVLFRRHLADLDLARTDLHRDALLKLTW